MNCLLGGQDYDKRTDHYDKHGTQRHHRRGSHLRCLEKHGISVQRGQRALFSTKIWKNVKKTAKDGEEYEKMILTNASFFGRSQVSEIEVA